MKKLLWLPLLFSLLLVGCNNEKKSETGKVGGDYLDPIKVEIPATLEDDPELVNLIKETEAEANTLSNNIEDLAREMAPYIGKDADDMSAIEAMKVASIGLKFAAKNAKSIEIFSKIQEYQEQMEDEGRSLSNEQIEALKVVEETFEKHMEQLEKKYEKTFHKE